MTGSIKSKVRGALLPHFAAVIFLAIAVFQAFPQVTLPNGITVPREKFIVYLTIGHSNMTGRTPELDTIVHPRAWNFFIADCCQNIPDHTWVPARDWIHMDFMGSGGGPDMHFLKKMVQKYPDYYFGILNNAQSGAQCRANYLKGNGSGDLDLFASMMSACEVLRGKVTFGGIICMLGVSEAVHCPDSVCRSFSNDIALMVKEFRDTLALPTLPFLIGGFERDAPEIKTQGPFWMVVDSQTNLIPSKVSYSAIIPSDNLAYFDRWHYTWDAYETWTQRAVDIIATHFWPPNGNNAVIYPAGFTRQPEMPIDISLRQSIVTDALGRKTAGASKNAGSEDKRPFRILFSKSTKILLDRN
jgi:hypothetical protein